MADDLWRDGELWNTFISTGPAARFWTLARQHLPEHAARLERSAASRRCRRSRGTARCL
jgi:hypothetical protein